MRSYAGLKLAMGILATVVGLCLQAADGPNLLPSKAFEAEGVATEMDDGQGAVWIPPRSLSPFRLQNNNSMRWSFIVNLNNGKGRMGWLELTRGIGQCKSPGDFMEIVLTE